MRPFNTNSLTQASCLVCYGHLARTRRVSDRDVTWEFVTTRELLDDVEVFKKGKARVEPEHFARVQRGLRNELKLVLSRPYHASDAARSSVN